MTKPFMMLLVIAVVLGISWGGAFAGGVAFGKSQGEEPTASLGGGPIPGSPQQRTGGAGQPRRRPTAMPTTSPPRASPRRAA